MFVKGANTSVCAEQSGKVNIQEEQYVILCTKAHASHATKLSARKMLNVFSGSFSLLRAGKERERPALCKPSASALWRNRDIRKNNHKPPESAPRMQCE